MATTESSSPDWLIGGGAMGALIRSHDWASTPVGPIENWPQSLRVAAQVMLDSAWPTALYWGEEFILLYNDASRELAGDRQPPELAKPAREIFGDHWSRISPLFAKVMAGSGAIRSLDEHLSWEQSRLTEPWLGDSIQPVRDEHGSVSGVLTISAPTRAAATDDPTGREDALWRSELQFRKFAEASSSMIWIRAADTFQAEYVSPAIKVIFGISPEEFLASRDLSIWTALVLPSDRTEALEHMERVRRGERATFEYRIRRPDGQVRWIRDTAFPLSASKGQVQRIAGIRQDITAERTAQAHERLLLGELQHRVRNNLATIRSFARRTAEHSATVEDYEQHLEGRLSALARVQAYIARDPGAGVDLATMVADELIAHQAHEGEQVSIAGPALRLGPAAADRLGLALHELSTNAVKYGALSVPDGHVSISWVIEERNSLRTVSIAWTEHVPTNEVTLPTHQGFGMELLERSLAYELDASVILDFTPSGLRCLIQVPYSEVVLDDQRT